MPVIAGRLLRGLALMAGLAAAAWVVRSSRAVMAESAADRAPDSSRENGLGIQDHGIFSDLDERIQLAIPDTASPSTARAVVLGERHLLILYVDGWPVKPYPLGGDTPLERAGVKLLMRPGDARELAPLLTGKNVHRLAPGHTPAPGDADADGIPDPLDLLIGAKKTVLNAASYGAGYMKLDYPMGDVPRDVGVCTDVVVRATRNAGLDIQRALHDDIRRSRRSYPMVKGKGNKNIDHRRVKTLLPYFKRTWVERSVAIDDARDPLRPGDIVFMDTFPDISGPDHIGILSNRMGDSGLPLVINNWTHGFVTSEMDLLGRVPVTHRFRFRSR